MLGSRSSNNGTSFACGDGGTCPTGFTCENAYCVAGGSDSPDAAIPIAQCGTAVTSGEQHACELRSDATVWCWGRNDHGQLGDGTTTDRSTPVQVQGLTAVTAIGAGLHHTCAVTAGNVFCWGANDSNQLGDGTTTDRAVPVQVVGVTDGSAVVGGDSHSCELGNDGSVYCWGANGSGQLGFATTGSATAASPAAQVPSFTALTLAAHADTTCATIGTEAVRCWGANDHGQLGSATPPSSNAPLPISGVAGALAITVGRRHACAVDALGSAYCWGDNTDGQLGDGTGVASAPNIATTVALPIKASWPRSSPAATSRA